jgi:hypothetical protein
VIHISYSDSKLKVSRKPIHVRVPHQNYKHVLNGLILSEPEFDALVNFKKNNGKDWKFKLACAWGDGAYQRRYGCSELEAGHLQHLRNRPDRNDKWLAGITKKDLE